MNLHHVSDSDIMRAVRHHRRAVAALSGISFEGLSEATARVLRHRMERDLERCENELMRRGLEVSKAEA